MSTGVREDSALSSEVATAGARPDTGFRGAWRVGWRVGWLKVALVVGVIYLVIVSTFSLLTPAWENNDEADHVRYIEHIVTHGTPPRISLSNGIESHQPPLYYFIAAAWQELLNVPAFTPDLQPPPGPAIPPTQRVFEVSHDYTLSQQRAAQAVHELRLTSMLWGLLAVLAAVATGWLLTRRLAVAWALGLTVAVWPKFLVVMASVTNSSLVISMCACAIPLCLLWQRSRRPIWAAATGVTLGAAALTQETALPVAGLLLALLSLFAIVRRDWRSPLWAIGCFIAICGWWYVRDDLVYGDFLASAASRNYLLHDPGLPGLVRNPAGLSLSIVSSAWGVLAHSTWYDGGWNQLRLPPAVDWTVWIVAGSALLAACGTRLRGGLVLATCALGSAIAWLVIISSTTQAEGRYVLVGIVAWSAFLVVGSERLAFGRSLGLWLWPVIMAALDVYVLATWVLPKASI